MCGGKILKRACFPCEEQAIVHGRRQRATVRLAWKGTGVRTEREWIATPRVEMKEFHPAHEIASEQSHQFTNCELKESGCAASFDFRRQASAVVGLDFALKESR